MEAYLVHEAVENLTADQLTKIVDLQDAYTGAAKVNDVRAMVEINGRLHDAMYEPADNPEAMRMLKSGWELVVALRSRFPYTPERIAEICDQHDMIVEMIKRRNGAAAALLVRQHCESAAASLMEQVKYPA
ncbi:FCD domain-containing protein [Neorhizobium sp. T786]|uniref:GntR family transcriptional regulator n=1 Tax=Pseudorhizobium xiangyangii TaxID=2883104 RepID=UPI001CFF5FE3|nr:FCD domain-containing protein [Neorhizobium xiangyangii]MCB5205411.1 FCD domain-containing protein [Neorhizobium xiangyangii]